MAALLGVLVFDTLPGLFIGIAASLLLLLYRVSRPRIAVLGRVPGTDAQFGDVEQHPKNEVDPAVVVLRVEGGLFFANADALRQRVLSETAADGVHAVVIDAETVAFIDVTAARMLRDLNEQLGRDGVRLLVARDVGQVRDVLASAVPDAKFDATYPSVDAAVKAAGRADK
jgi:anti-anti-sigma factor